MIHTVDGSRRRRGHHHSHRIVVDTAPDNNTLDHRTAPGVF
jgi:hypothetical protein